MTSARMDLINSTAYIANAVIRLSMRTVNPVYANSVMQIVKSSNI